MHGEREAVGIDDANMGGWERVSDGGSEEQNKISQDGVDCI